MSRRISPTVRIAAGSLALASALEVCLLTWPPPVVRASEPRRLHAAGAQVAVETKPVMDDGLSTAVATQIVVPCPLGSHADLAARHIATVLAAQYGRDYQVMNLSPDAAREIAQQPDSQTVLFFVAHADGMPVCGD
jgi:hypothetical protein